MNESSVLLFIGLDDFETGSVDVLMIFFYVQRSKQLAKEKSQAIYAL